MKQPARKPLARLIHTASLARAQERRPARLQLLAITRWTPLDVADVVRKYRDTWRDLRAKEQCNHN